MRSQANAWKLQIWPVSQSQNDAKKENQQTMTKI